MCKISHENKSCTDIIDECIDDCIDDYYSQKSVMKINHVLIICDPLQENLM